MDLIRLRTKVFGQPLAIHSDKLTIILHALGDRLGLDVEELTVDAGSPFAKPANQRPSYTVANGIAIVSIEGTLMAKTSGLEAMSGCTSYDQITTDVKNALKDPSIKGVLLDIDSPGGSTSGLFELCDSLYSLRGDKPMYAIANDSAFSAAYAIASCADKIFVTRTGGVGSIGVFALHVDQSKADEKAGLKYSYVYHGDRKIDGNPHSPLSDDAKQSMQSEVDRQYQMFVSLVSRNRGVSKQTIAGTEAGCFFGDTAIGALADEVGTFEDAFAALVAATAQTSIINNNLKASEVTKKHMAKKNKNEIAIATSTEDTELNAALALESEAADEEMEATATVAAAKDCDADEPEMKGSKNDDEDDDDDSEDDDTDDDDKKDKPTAAALARIVNLCTLAGHSDLAASFINSGLTVKQVEKALLEKRAMKSTNQKVNTTLSAPASAFDSLNALAQEAKSSGGTKKSEAYAKALRANAHLYEEYLEERNDACKGGLTSKATKTYFATIGSKVRG